MVVVGLGVRVCVVVEVGVAVGDDFRRVAYHGRPHGRPREVTGGHGRPRKATGDHGKPREATGGHGKPREATQASSRAQILAPQGNLVP